MGIFDFWERRKLKEHYEGQIRQIAEIISAVSDPIAKKHASEYLEAAKIENLDTVPIDVLRKTVETELPFARDFAGRKLDPGDIERFRQQQAKNVSDTGTEIYRDKAKRDYQEYDRRRNEWLMATDRERKTRAEKKEYFDYNTLVSDDIKAKAEGHYNERQLEQGRDWRRYRGGGLRNPNIWRAMNDYEQRQNAFIQRREEERDVGRREMSRLAEEARYERERSKNEWKAERAEKNKKRLMMAILRLKMPELRGETNALSDGERAVAKIEWDSLGQHSVDDLEKMKAELEVPGQVRKQYTYGGKSYGELKGNVRVKAPMSVLDAPIAPDTRWYASKNLKRSAWSRFMGKDKNVVDVNKRLKELNGLHEKDWKKKEYEIRDLLVTRENYERAIDSGKLSPFQEAQYQNEINKINRRLTDLGILDVENVTSSTVGAQLGKLKSSHVSEHSKALDELRKKHGLREGEEYEGSYGGAIGGIGSWLGFGEEPASGVLVNIFALLVTWLIVTNGIVGPILDTFAFFIPFMSILKYPIYVIGIIIFYQFIKGIFYPFKEDFLALGHHHEMTVDDVGSYGLSKAKSIGGKGWSGIKGGATWVSNKAKKFRGKNEGDEEEGA